MGTLDGTRVNGSGIGNQIRRRTLLHDKDEIWFADEFVVQFREHQIIGTLPKGAVVTKKEWLKCEDPVVALYYMPGRPSDRKLRLFGCACVRRVWDQIPSSRGRKLVEIAENFADGLVAESVLNTAFDGGRGGFTQSQGYYTATEAAITTCRPSARDAAAAARYVAQANYFEKWAVERRMQASLFREIVGNPFQPAHVQADWKCWKDGTVVKLVQAIYE
jgi:hypothetical protein